MTIQFEKCQYYKGWWVWDTAAYRFGCRMRARNREELKAMIDLKVIDEPWSYLPT